MKNKLRFLLIIPFLALLVSSCGTQEETVRKNGKRGLHPLDASVKAVEAPVKLAFQSLKSFMPRTYGREEAELASRFKDIDDFNAKEEKNLVGGKWSISAEGRGIASTYFSSDDAFKTHGSSLVVDYNIPPASSVRFESKLNGLDVSQAKAVSFWMKLDPLLSDVTEVELADNLGHRSSVPLKPYIAESTSRRDWREVAIPCNVFTGIDFNCLKTFSIVFRGGREEFSGNLFLDNLSFFGEAEVFFLSLKDNLKGFPAKAAISEAERTRVLKMNDSDFLARLAQDTWGYLANVVDKRTNLPLDHIYLGEEVSIGDYTSPTNIGLYLASCMAARELRLISKEEMESRISSTLDTLEKLPRWKGLFHNYYSTTNLQVTGTFISAVDNGWLAVSLETIKGVLPSRTAARVEKLLAEMNFYEFYDEGVGQLTIGIKPETKELSENHYGLIASESRAASFIAIAKGNVEAAHWFMIFRTLPSAWKWQKQVPKGVMRKYEGVDVFEGYYEYEGRKIVPSWGGSLFEFLMPTLFLDEAHLAPKSLGLNDRIAAEIHRDYAKKRKYPVWGISPCATQAGKQVRYVEAGISEIATKGYPDRGVIAPYASLLALEFIPEDVIKNLRRLMESGDIYGQYGFFDSIGLKTGKTCPEYLCLDQAMSFLALANYLQDGVVRKKFHSSPRVKQTERLLTEEEFF
ncbi:MAG: glucoamylase family protein [Candidatus Omnitrophica bacterium]|nr:glucoamylase family protein [Candidatus Omnitrophota bacterium]